MGEGGCRRFADDSFGLQKNVAGGLIGPFEPLQHGCDCHGTDLGAVLMLCGEGDGQKAGVPDIVDSDDADLLGYANAVRGEAFHDLDCGDVVGADDCVGSELLEQFLDEARIFGVAAADQVLLEMDSVREESFAIACDSTDDGRCREWLGNEGNALCSVEQQMLGEDEAYATIVDSDEIVLRAHGIWGVTTVEQDNLYAFAVECRGDAAIDGVLFGGELQGGEEDSGDFLSDVLMAEMLGLLFLLCGISHGVSPEKRVWLG